MINLSTHISLFGVCAVAAQLKIKLVKRKKWKQLNLTMFTVLGYLFVAYKASLLKSIIWVKNKLFNLIHRKFLLTTHVLLEIVN